MAAAPLGIRPPDPYLEHPGNPTIPFQRWERSLGTYMTASKLDQEDDKVRKAVILNMIGSEGQRIFFTAVSSTAYEALTYTQLLNRFRDQFDKPTNVVAERFKFRKRAQLPSETVDQYITTLRELASTCSFGNFEDDMIRDQLVEKTNSTRIQQRLLMEVKPLKDCISLAKQIESGMHGAELIQSAGSSAAATVKTEPIHAIRKGAFQSKAPNRATNTYNTNKKIKCLNCGKAGHK